MMIFVFFLLVCLFIVVVLLLALVIARKGWWRHRPVLIKAHETLYPKVSVWRQLKNAIDDTEELRGSVHEARAFAQRFLQQPRNQPRYTVNFFKGYGFTLYERAQHGEHLEHYKSQCGARASTVFLISNDVGDFVCCSRQA